MDENQFRAICQNALEGLASKKLRLTPIRGLHRRGDRIGRALPGSVAYPAIHYLGPVQKGLAFRSASSIGVVVRRGANDARMTQPPLRLCPIRGSSW